MSNLYDLSKDMLVKLVLTIQEDTIKECRKKEEEKMLKMSKSWDRVRRCFFEGCEKIQITGYRGVILFENGKIYDCQDCKEYFCPEHKEDHFYCTNCRGWLCSDEKCGELCAYCDRYINKKK